MRQIIQLIIITCILPGILLSSGCTMARSAKVEGQPFRSSRYDIDTGLIGIYSENMGLSAYVSSIPCISGGWVFKGETSDYWLVRLNNLTDNEIPGVVKLTSDDIKVAKLQNPPFDPAGSNSFHIIVVLARPAGDSQVHRLIAYTEPALPGKSKRQHHPARHLFYRHLEMRYQK